MKREFYFFMNLNMLQKNRVSIWELHDWIKTVQYNSESIDWAIKNAVYEVSDKVYEALYGDKWKEAIKEVASDLFDND